MAAASALHLVPLVNPSRRQTFFASHLSPPIHELDWRIYFAFCPQANYYYSTRTLNLNLQTLQSLDKEICSQYDAWVTEAPEAYAGFFQDRAPIIITSSYGQNQQLGHLPHHEEDNWTRYRDFSKVRFMTVALATHLWYEVIHAS